LQLRRDQKVPLCWTEKFGDGAFRELTAAVETRVDLNSEGKESNSSSGDAAGARQQPVPSAELTKSHRQQHQQSTYGAEKFDWGN